jgi:hypothetical protein
MRFTIISNQSKANKTPNNRFSKLTRKQRLRKTFRSSFKVSSLSSLAPLNLLLAGLFAVSMLSFPLRFARASNPAAGSITSTGPTQQWDGTAAGTGAANESACVEGVNCDTYTLTVAPGDYTGKLIVVKIQWTNPANDYDLYIHKDSNAGPIVGSSADGAPQTSESASIDPTATGTGVYTVHALYFAVTPLADQYHGTATVQNAPQGRNANYLKDGISFSSNVTVKAPSAGRDGEPSSRTDNMGNHYVVGIRGVPAGVDLWYFDLQPGSPSYDPMMRHPLYRGQPDSFTEEDATSVGADGGGDVDLAVGFPDPTTLTTNNPPTVAASSLVAANISTQRSTDKGVTFQNNPLGNATGGAPGDDREWQEFYGKDKVYLYYRTLEPAVSMIQRSTDGGLTYGPAKTAGAIGQAGSIDVHQASGTVYISGSTGQVCVGTPPPFPAPAGSEPLTYTCNVAASDPNGVAHLFFSVKVADDGTPFGTAYVAYSNDKDIFLVHSTDKGATWSKPVRVSDGPDTRTSVVPWMETGPTPGSVGITWYGTTENTNNDSANWNVFYAQSFNATADKPTFRQVKVSDHFIHGSNISEGGTLGNANRNLLDYYQISFDPTGAAVIDYTDDHNDFDGHTYVARQISGPSIKGGSVPAPVQGSGPFAPGLNPPPAQPGPGGEQVTDFAEDQTVGLLAEPGGTSPLDITSIKYSCEGTTDPVIVATMKVSDLTVVPPAANWRMSFTANAPNSKLSATGDYTYGLSDRGDQFFVRANTDTNPAGTFTFGTAVRNSDGTLTYTSVGNADSGAFDTVNKTITIKVSASKLNPLVTHGPAVGNGSVLVGLRGQAFTSGANAIRDITRGGTQYTISCGPTPNPSPSPSPSPSPGPSPSPSPGVGNVIKVTGGGNILNKLVSFGFNADNTPSGNLNYQDKGEDIHLVSDSIDSFSYDPGTNEVTFMGRGHVGRDPVLFTVKVQDNGEPGTNDRFSIMITGARTSSRSGVLTQGNIQFHR